CLRMPANAVLRPAVSNKQSSRKEKARPDIWTGFFCRCPTIAVKTGILEPRVQDRLSSSQLRVRRRGRSLLLANPTTCMPKALVQGMYGRVTNTAGTYWDEAAREGQQGAACKFGLARCARRLDDIVNHRVHVLNFTLEIAKSNISQRTIRCFSR